MAGFAGNVPAEAVKKTVFGEVSKDCKLVVVGIDFGTAYSGIAWAYKADPRTIRYDAPGASEGQTKVPTVLVQLPDKTWKFGSDAQAVYRDCLLNEKPDEKGGAQLYQRFKMVLKDKTEGLHDLCAPSEKGVRCKLLDLVTESLKFLKEFAMKRVVEEFGGVLRVEKGDVQWVLTVPAIWNDFGKTFMRVAAHNAGLTDALLSDQLRIVLEPEAAALAVQEGFLQLNLLNTGNRFMVVDCGGGTIDITAHEVTAVEPAFAMKGICIPAGGAWGGERVNANFRSFLAALLTPENFNERDFVMDFHAIYSYFDRLKKDYNPKNDSAGIINVGVVLERRDHLVKLVENYNKRCPAAQRVIATDIVLKKGHLPLNRSLMMSFFEPLLVEVVNCTRSVLNSNRGITNIIVVGGFGASEVVKDRMFNEFNNKNGVICTSPVSRPKPQGAIAHGAVYQGLFKAIITHRIAPFTYGIAVKDDKFRVLVTQGDEVAVDAEESVTGVPVEDDQDFLTWRVYRSELRKPPNASSQTKLGQLSLACPRALPGQTNEDRKQTAVFQFGRTEIVINAVNTAGERRRESISMH